MFEEKLKGKYLWGMAFALFVAACGVKWFYLAQQHYHILLTDEALHAFDFSEFKEIKELLRRLFCDCDYTLGSVRPFFTNLLYILTFKVFAYQPQAVLVMGIFVGSLLVPLYFLTVAALVNVEVALAASVIVLWMTNYVYQSISLTTILPGILFITGALLAAVRYHKKGGSGCLYLSGFLISTSIFCRYENVFLLPVFLGYECLFDKKNGFFTKLAYGLLCFSSSLYILCCNYRLYGELFHMVRAETAQAVKHPGYGGPVPWSAAFGTAWELLQQQFGLGPLPWAAAVAGMIFMLRRHKFRSLWLFLGVLPLSLFLIYKIRTDTLLNQKNYFLLLALIALSLGMEFLRVLFSGLCRRRICGIVALGLCAIYPVVSFHKANSSLGPRDTDLYFEPRLISLTEDLKSLPAGEALYIDNALNRPGFYIQEVLVYSKRNPETYSYRRGVSEPPEKEYYLLTMDSLIDKLPQGDAVKVRDYRAYGFDGLALYRITRSINEKQKNAGGPAFEKTGGSSLQRSLPGKEFSSVG